ncbi:MAG: hypothetical protein ABIC91_07695 [Nanoarchaeota archaeon]
MNIKNNIDENTINKLFGSNSNIEAYLIELEKIKKNIGLNYKLISKGKNKGEKRLNMCSDELKNKIISTWNYKLALKIIRDLFKSSNKYANGKNAKKRFKVLIKEWTDLNLGEIKWPCSQGNFDEFVQRVNNSSELEKDKLVSKSAIKYRRMKELNTVRNDFLETLIFEKNENILPTLKHTRGTDYFIGGESFDQKVSKSPTDEFKRKYEVDWRVKAITNPKIVAQFLYTYQDEGRFGADNRLLLVYLDEVISSNKIEQAINKINLKTPIKVKFSYQHAKLGKKNYEVKCFIIILSN